MLKIYDFHSVMGFARHSNQQANISQVLSFINFFSFSFLSNNVKMLLMTVILSIIFLRVLKHFKNDYNLFTAKLYFYRYYFLMLIHHQNPWSLLLSNKTCYFSFLNCMNIFHLNGIINSLLNDSIIHSKTTFV